MSGEAFADSGMRAGEALACFVIPLSVHNHHHRPEHVATGILMRIDGYHFIATAGHATVQTRTQHLFAGFDGMKLQRLPALVRQASRVDVLEVDDLDIGLMPWPPSNMSEFAGRESLEMNSLRL